MEKLNEKFEYFTIDLINVGFDYSLNELSKYLLGSGAFVSDFKVFDEDNYRFLPTTIARRIDENSKYSMEEILGAIMEHKRGNNLSQDLNLISSQKKTKE